MVPFLSLFIWICFSGWPSGDQETEVVFFAMGDPQYGGGADDKNRFQVNAMNALPGLAWPDGQGKVQKPLGLLIAGDLTQNGRDGRGLFAGTDEIGQFIKDYGLSGKDGRLHFPVYEGYGNHDFDPADKPNGFGTWRWWYRKNTLPAVTAVMNRNRNRVGNLSFSKRGGHYSWDWGRVHLVNLNLYPGNNATPNKNQKGREPDHSFDFLREDLKEQVGNSGRPVMIMHHYGYDSFGRQPRWWTDEDRVRLKKLLRAYNVVGLLHGHTHNTSHYSWEGYDVYNLGSPYYKNYNADGKGHFTVFRLTGKTLRVYDVAWNPERKGTKPHFSGWVHQKEIELGKAK